LPSEAVESLLLGNIQGQIGWGFEHPGLVEGVPAHGRGFGTRSLKVPSDQNDFVIL